jgi:hypothetical protein
VSPVLKIFQFLNYHTPRTPLVKAQYVRETINP